MSTSSIPAVPIEHKILLSRHEAARVLGISVPMLDSLVASGELKHRCVGTPTRGRVMFSKPELERFAEGTTSKG